MLGAKMRGTFTSSRMHRKDDDVVGDLLLRVGPVHGRRSNIAARRLLRRAAQNELVAVARLEDESKWN